MFLVPFKEKDSIELTLDKKKAEHSTFLVFKNDLKIYLKIVKRKLKIR